MPAAHSPAADSSTTTARPVTDGTVPQAGTILTHPVHGPVRVLSVRSRRVRGTATRYVELEVIGQSMRIAIPLGHSEDEGLRDLLAEDQIEDVLDQLAQPSPPAPARGLIRRGVAETDLGQCERAQLQQVPNGRPRRAFDATERVAEVARGLDGLELEHAQLG